jgi:uncharacterized integral membrane protein
MPEDPHALDAPDLVVPAQGPSPEHPAAEHPAPEHPEATEHPAEARKPRPTWLSGLWIAIGCFGVLLLFALIFVLQNDRSVDITYFGAHGHLPLGVALLLAAIVGGMLVTLVGTARILQLRAAARRHHKKS